MLETAIQERTEPHFHHILLAKQVTRPVYVARGTDPEMGTVGAILATHLYITSCSGLNGVPPSTNSCVPRTSDYDLIWNKGLCQCRKPPAKAGDTKDASSSPGSGRSPGEGDGNLLQYSCLENPTDRGAWWATVHRAAESDTTE